MAGDASETGDPYSVEEPVLILLEFNRFMGWLFGCQSLKVLNQWDFSTV